MTLLPVNSVPYFRFLLASVLAVLANCLLWAWLGRHVELPDVPGGQFDCLSYTPFEAGSDPRNADDKVSMATIEADMLALRPVTRCVRVYTSRGATPEVLAAAQKYGLQVLLGIWVSGDSEGNALEISAALGLASQYPETVTLLVVGNEVLLRRELTADRLIQVIDGVRGRTTVPVAYADVYEFWARYPEVAGSVDMILVHILPYWDDPPPHAADAQPYLEAVLKRFLAIFPGKPVMIGETGWPSAGPARDVAVASVVDQARFVRGFIQRAHALGVQYNLIEALDQPWKRASEGTAGGFWGILTADREQKFALVGPVSEWPQWHRQAVVAVSCGLLLGLAGLWFATWLTALPAALLTQVAGTVLVLSAFYILDVGQGWLVSGLYWCGWLLSILAALAALDLLLRGPTALLSGKPVPLAAFFAVIRSRQWAFKPGLVSVLLHFAMTFPVAVITLTLAVSARHRDVPWLLLVMPASYAVLWWWNCVRAGVFSHGREEGWLALVMLLSAGFCWQAIGSVESALWVAGNCLLVLPWLDALRALCTRLFGVARHHA